MQSSWPSVLYVTRFSAVTQVGLYHDQQTEDGGSSKENRNIYSESMPRRVGSFYRGRFSHAEIFFFTALCRSGCQFRHLTAFNKITDLMCSLIRSHLNSLWVEFLCDYSPFQHCIFRLRHIFRPNNSTDV